MASEVKPLLAAAIQDTVQLWSEQEGKLKLASICENMDDQQPASNVNCVEFNHNNKVVISCRESGNVFMNLCDSGKHFGKLSTEKDEALNGFSLSQNSRFLCTGGTSAIVKVWDLTQQKLIQKFPGHTDAITCLSFDATDEYIASGSNSGDVLIHSREKMTLTKLRAPNSSSPITFLQYSKLRNNLLGTSSDDGSVHVWDVNTSKPFASFPNRHASACTCLNFSVKNNLLFASGGLDKKLNFYDVNEKRSILVIDTGRPITALAFMEDGHSLAVGTSGRLILYDLRNNQQAKASVQVEGHVKHLAVQMFKRRVSAVHKPASAATPQNAKSQIGKAAEVQQQSASAVPQQQQASVMLNQQRSPSPAIAAASVIASVNKTPAFPSARMSSVGGLDVFSPTRDIKDTMKSFSAIEQVKPAAQSVQQQAPMSSGLQQQQLASSAGAKPKASSLSMMDSEDIFSPIKMDEKSAALNKRSSLGLQQQQQQQIQAPQAAPILQPQQQQQQQFPKSSADLSTSFHISQEPSSLSFMKPSNSSAMEEDDNVDLNKEWNNIVSNPTPIVEQQQQKQPPLKTPAPQKQLDKVNFSVEKQASVKRTLFDDAQKSAQPNSRMYAFHLSASLQNIQSSPDFRKQNQQQQQQDISQQQLLRDQQLQLQQQEYMLNDHNQQQQMSRGSTLTRGQQSIGGNDFYVDFLKNTLEENLTSFKASVHQDIQNLHLDLLRQFHNQQEEMANLINKLTGQIKPLVDEIQELREENKILKQKLFQL